MSTAEVRVTLSDAERMDLEAHEEVIRRGLATFLEVGKALEAIRTDRLYRGTHGTFEGYCRERFGLAHSRVYQLVESAKIGSSLSTNGGQLLPILPSERAVRPLGKLPEGERAAAWDEALEAAPKGKPTAKVVEEIVERRLNQSRVNGVLTADPPEIRIQRERGILAPDVVPEVTVNAGPIPEEIPPRDAGEDEPATEEEWLATLPLSAELRGKPLKTFRGDAKVYRRLEPARAALKTQAEHAMKAGRKGEFAYYLLRFLAADDPKHWRGCPPPEQGGCGGSGLLTPGVDDPCPRCHGRGYSVLRRSQPR